ncbi:MAG: hypothetical protein RR253_07000, partial [Oscillospiraceae bacterium]
SGGEGKDNHGYTNETNGDNQSTTGGGGARRDGGTVSGGEGKDNHGYTNETNGDNQSTTGGGIGTAPCDSLSPPVKSAKLHGGNRPGTHPGKVDNPPPKEAPKPIKEFDENYKSDEYRQPKDGNGYTEDAYTVAQKFIDRTQFPLG